jgi:hypothetical protein
MRHLGALRTGFQQFHSQHNLILAGGSGTIFRAKPFRGRRIKKSIYQAAAWLYDGVAFHWEPFHAMV